ncbi:unnamed protein product, partial [Rotaria sp. Silwood1]
MNFGVDKDSSLIDTSVLPNDIFTRVDDDFFSIVKALAGDSVFNILRIQLINSARKLLSTPDVFAFFQIESEETDKIKAESCFKSKTGQYFVKPGIQTSLSYLIKLLNQKLKEELTLNENNETRDTFISNEFIDKHPLLKSLIRWYQQNDSENNNKANRYTESIKKFAICLYIFGGKQCYEFVRLNMPGSIPHLSTLGDLINKSNMTLTEAEFKFDSLQKFQSGFGFCSEGTTGVIPKVEYDSSTNSFIGFTTPIVDGIPLTKHYQADTFDDFKIIYSTDETAPLLNVHMFQSISTEDDPTNFSKPVLLSAYGVDNKFRAMDILRRWMYIFERCLDKDVRIIGFSTVKQQHLPKQALINIHLFNSQPCESLFRDARSLSSTSSTVVNFTVKDFMRRSQKLSILNQFKHNHLEKDLSFPIHHKHKCEHPLQSSHQLDNIDTLDIQKLISNAYDQALRLVKYSKILVKLNEHQINYLNDLSSYIFNMLNKNSRMINYSFRTENNTTDEFGLDEENEDNDVINYAPDQLIDEILFDAQSDGVSDDDENILNSTKSDFNGIRIVDNINPAIRKSYFKVKINDNIKYLHKQSACWLQSSQITKLSSDRLSRVMQQT